MVIVKNIAGQVYWPAFGINQIGDWDVLEAYKVYMAADHTLIFTGSLVVPEDNPIDLGTGWSMIPYLRDTPMPIETALADLSDTLVIVKNNAGQVYWPAFGINQIGVMQPGEGYQIYLSAPDTLTYPPND